MLDFRGVDSISKKRSVSELANLSVAPYNIAQKKRRAAPFDDEFSPLLLDQNPQKTVHL